MNKSVNYKYSIALMLCTTLLFAQKKVETFNASKDLVVEVNTTHTHVVFETWNKNLIEVEAFIEGNTLSKEEKQEIFDNWDFEVFGNSKTIKINSSQGNNWNDNNGIHLDIDISDISELSEIIVQPLLKSIENLEVEGIPLVNDFPQWPFSKGEPNIKNGENYTRYHFKKGLHFDFDTDEYEENKQKYVSKLNKKYKSNVSVNQVDSWLEDVEDWSHSFEDAMEDWGENFGKKFEEKFGKDFENKMEEWGENFGEKMENWGENFGKEIEKWAEQFGDDIENWAEQFEGNPNNNYNTKEHNSKNKSKNHSQVKKTILIRMPQETKTNINVRHGNLKMADVYNVKATLNYASFIANSVDGNKSIINASYAPIKINHWIDGDLHIKYVEDCKINRVKKINLNANSSDVIINKLEENAFLTGSFGNLFINTISTNFNAIDIVLENTDATIKLPSTSFSFYYNGKKSKLTTPSSLVLKQTINGNQVLQKGYNKTPNTLRNLTINASYSNVLVK